MPAVYSFRYSNANALVSVGGVPSAPVGLTITAVTDSSIELSWTNADDKETGIEVQRRDDEDTWTTLDTEAAGTETYEHSGLSANVAGGYRVRAVNGAGESPWSNVVVGATSESGAVLHTTGNWQKTLRAWLESFAEEDFDVDLDTITDTTFETLSDEEVWQAWHVMQNRQADAPSTKGFKVASSHFLLSAIENGGTINMRAGRGGFVEPITTAFYAYWDHPLNPQYDREALYRRALVAVAVDMIEARYLHDTNAGYRISDYTGGWILKWVMPLWMYENHPGSAMTALNENTKDAMREGIRRMWDNTLAYNAGGNGGGDLEAFQLRAMPYMYDLGIITLQEYKDRASRVISEIVNPRGGSGFYHDHGGGTLTGIDIAYEGIWWIMLADAAVSESFLVPGVTILKDALVRLLDYLAHTTCIDYAPDVGAIPANGNIGRVLGPSHFNSGTPGGIGFQYEYANRYWTAAYLTDVMTFRLFKWHRNLYYVAQKEVLSRTGMTTGYGINSSVTAWNNAVGLNNGVSADASSPGLWDFRYFADSIPVLAIHGVTGFWTELKAVLDADDDENLLQPPYLRTADFVKNYYHLVAAKVGNYATTVHNGPVVDSWAGNPSALRGGISSFWIKDRGTFVLGVGTGGQDNVPDTWSTHDTWAVNTVSGTTSAGKFSESRYVAQGLAIRSLDLVGKSIRVADTVDLTSLFKKGDKITYEDWNTGIIYIYTLSVDAVNANGITTLTVDEPLTQLGAVYNGVVGNHYVETGDDYFIQETRSLIDTTKASTTTNSTTINGLIINRRITANAQGTEVRLKLISPGTDVTTDVWEQIPVYQGKSTDTYDIEYWNGSAWTTLSTTYVSTNKIRLTRDVQAGDGDVYAYIALDGYYNVKLSSARVAPGTDVDYVRNVKIQLSDTLTPKLKLLTYTLQDSDPA